MKRNRQALTRTHWEAITDWLGGFKPIELIFGMVTGITVIAALLAAWGA